MSTVMKRVGPQAKRTSKNGRGSAGSLVCYSVAVSRSLKAHILLVLITLIWGSNFVVIKNALADISPLFFNAVRMSLAAVVLAAIFYRELPRLTASAVRAGCLVGVFLFIGNELQTVGLKYTTPSKSAFLTGVSVVLVPVFLALFWKRAINRWTSVGVVLALVGLYLLTVPASPGAGLNLRSMNHGDLLTLGAAVVFAFQIIFIEHTTQAHRWQQITAGAGCHHRFADDRYDFICGESFGGVVAASTVGDWDYRVPQPGAGLCHPGVGAAVHARDSHRADLYPGAGVCLADVIYFSG